MRETYTKSKRVYLSCFLRCVLLYIIAFMPVAAFAIMRQVKSDVARHYLPEPVV